MKFTAGNDQDYEIWDMDIPPISSRTILYNLIPVGIGTPEVESLSGYISRLAQEHRLSPVVLLKNSVSDLSELPKTLLQNSISATFAGSLNGFGETTEVIISILQKATQCTDIFRTTLLPWKFKLSNHRLLKKNLAWCAPCFEDQREKGIVYEKLLWSFYNVNACHVHNLPLTEQCPHCNKKLKVLSGRSRPGFCSVCRCWLGSNLVRFDEFRNFRDDEEKKREIWKAVRSGEFLSETPFPFTIENDGNDSYFVENLSQFIRIFAQGSINNFSYKAGIWHVTVRRLLSGEVSPTMEIVLKLNLFLQIPPAKLFEKSDFGCVEANISNPTEIHLSKAQMETELSTFHDEYPPPSANEVARRTGWTTMRLQRHFPEKYKLIVERYANLIKQKVPDIADLEVESILLKASQKKPPPSLQSVFRTIGCQNTGYRYYQRFPDLCRKIANRYKRSKLKKFDIERAERIMQTALEEIPPPSYSEIARRIGCTRENLRKKLPELSYGLRRRYESHLLIRRSENIQQLNDEVKKAFTKLQDENTIISMSKIMRILPRKWNEKRFKNAYQMILEEMIPKTEN